MPIVPNFTAASVLGEPSQILLTDTSTGSDAAIASRRITLRLYDNTFLVPAGNPSTQYITWLYAASTKNVDALDTDYAINITVEWLNVSSTVLYTKTILFGFTAYNEAFDYSLTEKLSANPLLTNDDGFQEKRGSLRTDIDSGNNAVTYDDIYAAQQCYDRASELRIDDQYYFNTSG